MRHKLASEGFGEDRLIKVVDQLAGAGRLGGEPVDPGEGGLISAREGEASGDSGALG